MRKFFFHELQQKFTVQFYMYVTKSLISKEDGLTDRETNKQTDKQPTVKMHGNRLVNVNTK